MSVVSVTILNAGRTGSVNDEFRREYERTFRVVTDNPYDGQGTACAAPGIPLRHSTYAEANFIDRFALCESVTAHPEDEEFPLNWIVTARYSTKIWDEIRRKGGDQQQQSQPENPLTEPVEVSFDLQDFDRVIDVDLKGKAIVNSAGERFGGKTIQDALLIMTIVKNQAQYSPQNAIDYFNAVNSDFFFGFGSNRVKCKGFKGNSVFKNDYYYWKVTYVFQINTRTLPLTDGNNVHQSVEGWAIDECPLDHGPRQLVAGKLVPIVSGGVVVDDARLNGNGVYVGDGSTNIFYLVTANPGPGPAIPGFTFYNRKVFSDLGI